MIKWETKRSNMKKERFTRKDRVKVLHEAKNILQLRSWARYNCDRLAGTDYWITVFLISTCCFSWHLFGIFSIKGKNFQHVNLSAYGVSAIITQQWKISVYGLQFGGFWLENNFLRVQTSLMNYGSELTCHTTCSLHWITVRYTKKLECLIPGVFLFSIYHTSE